MPPGARSITSEILGLELSPILRLDCSQSQLPPQRPHIGMCDSSSGSHCSDALTPDTDSHRQPDFKCHPSSEADLSLIKWSTT
jgi:hypothetical protein